MKFQFFQPAGILARYIKQYWILESESSEDVTERVIPTGNIELMFHYGTPFVVKRGDANSIIQPRCFISGISSKYADVSTRGASGVIAVTFYPHGACNFFRFPLSEIENAHVALTDVFCSQFRETEEKIQYLPQIGQKIALVEAFLLKQLKPVSHSDSSFLNYSVSLINKHRGLITASELSANLLLSSKSLERKFSNLLGKTPKQYLKIVRFQETIRRLSDGNNIALTALAYEGGYFDQAHFIRDFKMLSGYTPREFISLYPCQPDYSGQH